MEFTKSWRRDGGHNRNHYRPAEQSRIPQVRVHFINRSGKYHANGHTWLTNGEPGGRNCDPGPGCNTGTCFFFFFFATTTVPIREINAFDYPATRQQKPDYSTRAEARDRSVSRRFSARFARETFPSLISRVPPRELPMLGTLGHLAAALALTLRKNNCFYRFSFRQMHERQKGTFRESGCFN